MPNERGEIYFRARAKQLRDYSKLRYGNITPTDIDGLIEYHGKCFVIIELKYKDSSLSYGQKLALERLTDDLGKPVICIIASHDTDNPDEDIDVSKAIVSEYRFKEAWRVPKIRYTVKDLTDKFLELIDGS